jgi:uncharacterized cysteine cluster protein YcgN (CxxCxxCC family)
MSKSDDHAAGAEPGSEPFWRKPLEQMTSAEWESLCDGCGRCCLVKLEDEDTGDVHFTDVACELLSTSTCRCSDYPNRQSKIPDCVKLTPDVVRSIGWLPPTCGYRLVAEGRDLMWWHPLVSGRPETVAEAGVSVRGKIAASEQDVPIDHLPGYIVSWPQRVPARARRKALAKAVQTPPPATKPSTSD